MTLKHFSYVLTLSALIVLSASPARAGLFNANSGALDGLLASIDSNTAIMDVKGAIADMQAVQQTLIATQQMYYEIQSLKYLAANANNISGVIQAVSGMGSMLVGAASTGYSAYSGLATQFGLPNASSEAANSYLSDMAMGSSSLGAISSSASQVSNMGGMSGGMPGMALLNGSTQVVQAALTTTTAVSSLQSYMQQKTQNRKMKALAGKVAQQQNFAANQMRYVTVPCLNRAATVNVAAGNSAQPVTCTKVGAPRPVWVTNPVNSGVNASLRNVYEQQCAQAAQRNASNLIAGSPAPAVNVGAACGNLTPPVYAPAPAPAVGAGTAPQAPKMPPLMSSTPF